MNIRITAVALLALASACGPRAGTTTAGQSTQGTVKEEHFARIPEGQLGQVQQVREEIRDLRDELLRAEQQVTVADEKAKLSEANLEVVRAKANAAKQKVELAQSTGDRARIEQAQQEQAVGDAEVEVELARAELVKRQRDTLDLEARVQKAKLGLAEARLEQTKLAALRTSGDAAADQYDDSSFQQKSLSAQSALEMAEKNMQDHGSIVEQAQMRVDSAERTLASLRGGSDDVQPVRGEDEKEEK